MIVTVKFGRDGEIQEFQVDNIYYKGNYYNVPGENFKQRLIFIGVSRKGTKKKIDLDTLFDNVCQGRPPEEQWMFYLIQDQNLLVINPNPETQNSRNIEVKDGGNTIDVEKRPMGIFYRNKTTIDITIKHWKKTLTFYTIDPKPTSQTVNWPEFVIFDENNKVVKPDPKTSSLTVKIPFSVKFREAVDDKGDTEEGIFSCNIIGENLVIKHDNPYLLRMIHKDAMDLIIKLKTDFFSDIISLIEEVSREKIDPPQSFFDYLGYAITPLNKEQKTALGKSVNSLDISHFRKAIKG